MVTQTMPSDRDVRTLAAIVSQERPDRSEAGLPFSLLSDLAGQIPCDYVLFEGYDIKRQEYWFAQQVPDDEEDPDSASDQGMHQALWEHFWDCKFCSYPDRTGDLRSVFQVTDFYSVREWHSTGMYSDSARPQGLEARAPNSPSVTGRCSRCCALTSTRRTSTRSDAARPCPISPPGSGSCCISSRPVAPTSRWPVSSGCPRERCARTWRTSTPDWMSRIALPQ